MKVGGSVKGLLLLTAIAVLTGCSADLTSGLPPETIHRAIRYELIYALVGLFSGMGSIAAGFWLIVKGITGKIEWVIQGAGFESKLANATPGVVLFVVGLLIVILTRNKVKIRTELEGKTKDADRQSSEE